MAAKDHVAVRLDPPTLDRLDVLRVVLSTDWHEATQSDVLRAVILSGLKVLEKEHAPRLADAKKRRDAANREAARRDGGAEKSGAPSSRRGKKSKT
jgi:hypothetical protein